VALGDIGRGLGVDLLDVVGLPLRPLLAAFVSRHATTPFLAAVSI
jgi:hypothetical protein